MAIIKPPGWMGSDIVRETGKRWMQDAAEVLRMNRVGNFMSAYAAKSKEFTINLSDNKAFSNSTLTTLMSNACGGNWNGAAFVINMPAGQYLVSNSSGSPTMWFGGAMANCAYIRINNAGIILGRGGNGGYKAAGAAGGTAIRNEIGGKLQINNGGIIAGGGGGAGGWMKKLIGYHYERGGAGAPYGWSDVHGSASLTTPSEGFGSGQAGGGWGQNGSSGSYGAGAAGYCISGGGAQIISQGDMRGRWDH